MRIAYVINSMEGGGAALPIPAVATVLAAHGASVEVFALAARNRRSAAAIEAMGIPLHIREGGERDHLAAGRWLHRAVYGRFDLLWTSLTRATLIGQLVGQRCGIPVVSWQHNAFLKPANRRLLRLTQALSALWIADSHSVAALSKTRLGIPPERLMVWPLFAADPAAPQARSWRPSEILRIGSLGRLSARKGYDVLIAALARMQADGFRSPVPFQIVIAGEGQEYAALAKSAADHGLETIRFTGFCDAPRDFLATLHLYVQPSRAEGLCIAAHEAMQAGLSTIVSSVGEMPHTVIDGRTGLVVAPDDVAPLADALVQMLSHPDRLKIMGSAARSRILNLFGPGVFESAGAAVMAHLPV